MSTKKGFTDEERAAMKERARELKAAALAEEGESALLAKIAEMQEPDRAMGERIHAIVKASAPDLLPRLWYGMQCLPALRARRQVRLLCRRQPRP
jgi:hypothetical protein